jgi:hypothetical protein
MKMVGLLAMILVDYDEKVSLTAALLADLSGWMMAATLAVPMVECWELH